jgi:class 3 adenylate cyclase
MMNGEATNRDDVGASVSATMDDFLNPDSPDSPNPNGGRDSCFVEASYRIGSGSGNASGGGGGSGGGRLDYLIFGVPLQRIGSILEKAGKGCLGMDAGSLFRLRGSKLAGGADRDGDGDGDDEEEEDNDEDRQRGVQSRFGCEVYGCSLLDGDRKMSDDESQSGDDFRANGGRGNFVCVFEGKSLEKLLEWVLSKGCNENERDELTIFKNDENEGLERTKLEVGRSKSVTSWGRGNESVSGARASVVAVTDGLKKLISVPRPSIGAKMSNSSSESFEAERENMSGIGIDISMTNTRTNIQDQNGGWNTSSVNANGNNTLTTWRGISIGQPNNVTHVADEDLPILGLFVNQALLKKLEVWHGYHHMSSVDTGTTEEGSIKGAANGFMSRRSTIRSITPLNPSKRLSYPSSLINGVHQHGNKPIGMNAMSSNAEESERGFESSMEYSKLSLPTFSEFRQITVLFVQIHDNDSHGNSTPHPNPSFASPSASFKPFTAQRLFNVFQGHLSKWEGVFQQFSVDDKGQTMLACFGLPPFTHEKEAVHSLKAALGFVEDVKRNQKDGNSEEKRVLEDVYVTVGVTTGMILFSSLGTARRSEVSLLGDVVNLAARIGGVEVHQNGSTGRDSLVLCDQTTYELTKDAFQFLDVGTFQVRI